MPIRSSAPSAATRLGCCSLCFTETVSVTRTFLHRAHHSCNTDIQRRMKHVAPRAQDLSPAASVEPPAPQVLTEHVSSDYWPVAPSVRGFTAVWRDLARFRHISRQLSLLTRAGLACTINLNTLLHFVGLSCLTYFRLRQSHNPARTSARAGGLLLRRM